MAKKQQRGHYCRICGRQRANERFSGRGHARHICRDCEREQRQARQTGREGQPTPDNQPAPLTYAQLERLCAWLAGPQGCNFHEDKKTGEILWDCDNSLRLTRQWLTQAGLAVDASIRQLRDCGGFCACESVFNVLQRWPED